MPATLTPRRLLPVLAIGLALAVPAAIQTQPVPSQLAHQVAPNAGDSLFVTWTMASEAHALTHHPTEVFAANIFYPRRDAIAWSDNLLVAAPVFGLLQTVTGGQRLMAYNLIVLLGFLGVGLAVYALARRLVGGRGPALVAATVSGLSMSRSVSVGHFQLCGFLFVVLAMLALIRFLEQRGWWSAAGFGLATAATWLVSAYYAVMLALVAVPFLVVWMVQRRFRVGPRFWAGMAAAGAMAAVLVLPTLPPYVRLQSEGLFHRSTRQIQGVAWSDLWRVPPSLVFRTAAGVDPLARYDRDGLYPGLVLGGLVLVAAAGFVVDRRRRVAAGAPRLPRGWGWPLAVSCLPCLALMVGPHAPGGLSWGYDGLRAAVPGVASLRRLDRFWMWPLLCLSILAAAGAARVLARCRGRWQPAALAALLALAWAELLFRPPVVTVALSGPAVAANHALEALPAGPVLELPEPVGPTFPYVTAARQLRSLIDGNPRVDGYSGDVPAQIGRVENLASRASPPELVPVMRSYGVRYLVLHAAARPCSAGYDPGELQSIAAALRTTPGVVALFDAGADLVVELAPAPIDRVVPAGPAGPPRPAHC